MSQMNQNYFDGQSVIVQDAPAVDIEEAIVFPTSFAQQRLWFLDQLEPGSTAYNLPLSLRLNGELNMAALEAAFNEIVQRHEALRTTFAVVDGQPVQLIAPEMAPGLRFIDLRKMPEREQEAIRLAADESRLPFDLERGPLVRATLLRLDECDYVALFTMHHIISDGWSAGILVKEISALYDAFSKGQESPLEELPIQYADYAVWQREWLQGEVLEEQLAYWKRQLAGAPAMLELPTDRLRPAAQRYRGAEQKFALPVSLSESLKAIGQREGATLFMTLLAAFQVVLARYSGQNDISTGTPIAGRTRGETEGLIGFFVNTLVLRTDLSGEPTFRELLSRVREVCLGAYAHQDVPFEKLVEAMHAERDLSLNPLFQVMFSLQNSPTSALVLPGLSIREMEAGRASRGTAMFDMLLDLNDTPQGLFGKCEYNTDLFDAATIERFVAHLRSALEAIAADPNQLVSELPLLSEAEREQILAGWNDTAAEYPAESCVHELFEAQVERTPEDVAVLYKEESLSYAELNARANQLAGYLRRLGVGPEVRVGLCLERSLEMVVALLGVLKAGGAYVPLDPDYPQERLAFMVEDAQQKVLLTQERLLEKLPAHQAQVVSIDADWPIISRESTDNPVRAAEPANIAYVLYTSGSTGRPKGAMVTHAGLCNHMVWMQAAYPLTATDCVLQKTPFSFDASVWEFYAPLLAGARLLMAKPGGHQEGSYLVEVMSRNQVTTLQLVPTLLRMLLEEKELESCDRLRRVYYGGAPIGVDLQRQFHARLDADLINLYGPTETTIQVASWVSERTQAEGAIPIGRPINNAQLHILDRRMQPVPAGVNGELYIGGVCLGRGYFNRPDMTAEKYLPNPFSREKGARLYRTGDLARYLSGGVIEYVGRVDDQVKIRGYRIELGEIESALAQHESVRDAVVVARDDSNGEKRLIAYLAVGDGPQRPTTGDLRSHLKENLPEYMVPATFVMLNQLPLLPNGKVDRRSLPEPDLSRPELETPFIAPRNEMEEALAEVWKAVLGVSEVGIEDSFFELGGDSILSIQVVTKAQQRGLRLTPRQLFEHKTIGELAKVVRRSNPVDADSSPVTGSAQLTPIQHWFFNQNVVDANHWNQTLMLSSKSRLDGRIVEQATGYLQRHHDALRLRFTRSADGWQQTIDSPTDEAPFKEVFLTETGEQEQRAAIEAIAREAQASLDFERGPLVRVVLMQTKGDVPSRLLIVIHHLAVDGVSWRILVEDLQTLYGQLSSGEAMSLPPKTSSFKRWSEWLQQYAQTADVTGELEYWTNESRRDAAPVPVDKTDGENTVGSVRAVWRQFSEDETRSILMDVPPVYHTQVQEVLLAPLAKVLARWTGSRAVLVDVEGHGREELSEEIDLTRTVGWFTSMYPLVLEACETEAETAGGPGELLKRIKEQARSVPQRGIGYGLLRYLSDDTEVRRRLAEQPQAEVSFNYLGQVEQGMSKGLGWEIATESAGPSRSERGQRWHRLEVEALVTGGRLNIGWRYSESLHNQETIARLAEEYSEELRRLIEHCRSEEAGGFTPSDFPLAKLDQGVLDRLYAADRQIEDIYPLSLMQQGMLFDSLFAPDSGVYCMQMNCELQGELNFSAFERAWQRILDRHDVLRTSFLFEGLNEPLQVLHQRLELPCERLDWRGLSTVEQQERLAAFLAADRARGFELADAPLMRLTLIRLKDDTYRFVWSHHHILLDGWSMPLIFKEVMAFYDAFGKGQDLQLDAPLPYKDLIGWLQSRDLAEAESFWRETLKGFRAPNTLGSNGAAVEVNSAEQQKRFTEAQIFLPAALTTTLQTWAGKRQLTLNTLIQGMWALLLGRLSGSADVVFGSTVSGRPLELPGVESRVGLFINTLPVRVEVPPQATLLSWLEQLQSRQVMMRQYEYVSLAQIQRWSEVPRSMQLFESILSFENYPFDAAVREWQGGLTIRHIQAFERSGYPLTLLVQPGTELSFKMVYDVRRFKAAAATRILAYFETLLALFVSQPDATLSDLQQALDAFDREQKAAEEQQLAEASARRFKGIKRKTFSGTAKQAEENGSTLEPQRT
jgi:amino acid adenylation domain-containing protein/non-ribosomal peptide synthase protein (TIGR01720 family)